MKTLTLLSLLFYFNLSEGARILGIFPMASPSHYILGNALLKGLAEAGHDVTIVSPYAEKDPPKNGSWREIVLEDFVEIMRRRFEKMDVFQMEKYNHLLLFLLSNGMGATQTENTLNHTKVQKLLHSDEKFDVVIVSQFMNDAMKAFASHFGAHLVLFSNVGPNTWLNHLVGNPSLPSHNSEILLGYPKKMTFFQRVVNTLFKLLMVVNLNVLFYPNQNRLLHKYFPNPVDLNDVLYNVSLVLLNSHVSVTNPHPLVPCMVEIGGFHISASKKLPEDLQTFLDNATDGVIYFSMGSNLKSKDLPVEKREAILKAFGKRKEKVLWKWEDDVLPGQPSNVKLGKWLPQQSVLAHPNVKAFITHGGMLSTTEAVYFGVPIIAIPIFADQKMNANSAQQAGYGLILPFQEITEERLSSFLDEILVNPKYSKNVKERSRIMNDRQVKPLDTAIYWIEYVIRHNGAKHLRVAYLDLTWYEYYLLDVFAFISAVMFLVAIVIRKIFSYLCRRRIDRTKEKQN